MPVILVAAVRGFILYRYGAGLSLFIPCTLPCGILPCGMAILRF